MADKAEKDLDQASDCGWIRGLDARGNPIKLNKADMVELIRANMPVATSEKKGLLDQLDYRQSMFYRGYITNSEINIRLSPGLYYRDESFINGTSRYGMLVVLVAQDIQFQFDLSIGGYIFYRMSYGADENPTWGKEWTKLI